MQGDASAAGFRARGGARDLLSQAHEHEQGAQGGPQGGTRGGAQGGDHRFMTQQSSSGGSHMGGREGLPRAVLSHPLTEQGALSLEALQAFIIVHLLQRSWISIVRGATSAQLS